MKSAKEALLLWCQLKTAKYPNVCVNNLNQSWRSGMAFNALIHAHRPDLIEYDRLDSTNPIYNLNLAFDVASRELGVPRLLDAEDFTSETVDERSIVTYLSCFYQTLTKIQSDIKCSKRIANIISQLIEVEKLQLKYEYFTKTLLNWIRIQTNELKDRNLANNSVAIQHQLIKFKEYITIEKPPKLRERNECEAIHFEIQTVMKSLGHSLYAAPPGLTVKDIEREWTELEKQENKRLIYLRQEFLRLEKLENLANRFERKCVLRETYIKDKLKIISEPIYGDNNKTNFEANYKKHKMISADISAQTDKFKDLTVMARQLCDGNYYDKDEIILCERHITNKWQQLLDMLRNREYVFGAASELLLALKEAENISLEIREMKKGLKPINKKSIRMPFGVEELIENHNIFEAQVVSKGRTIRKLNTISESISGSDSEQEVFQIINRESPHLSSSLTTLNTEYTNVSKLVGLKKQNLNEMRDYFRLIDDIEEEETTISERQRICQSVLVSKDLIAVLNLQRKHELLVIDIKTQEKKVKYLINCGQKLINNKHSESVDIQYRIDGLKQKWNRLNVSILEKSQHINDAIKAFQYHKEANEVEAWLKEKKQLIDSQDCEPTDEWTASAQLRRHSQLEREIRAFDCDIKRLNSESDKILNSGISSLFVLSGDPFSTATQIGCTQMQNQDSDDSGVQTEDKDGEGSPVATKRKRLSIICNAESVEERQSNINCCYLELLNLSFIKRKKLKEWLQLSKYNTECDGIQSWIMKTQHLMTDINMNYERGLITDKTKLIRNDLISCDSMLDKLELMAINSEYNEEFSVEQLNRHKRMRLDWNQLNVMMNELEDALNTVEDMNSTCNQMVVDLSHQINEKDEQKTNETKLR